MFGPHTCASIQVDVDARAMLGPHKCTSQHSNYVYIYMRTYIGEGRESGGSRLNDQMMYGDMFER